MSSKLPQVYKFLPRLPTISEIMKMYNVHAKKNLSQNFLLDSKLTTKFVSRAGKVKDSYVCEVGPGPGNITRSILNFKPKHVIVIEKDERFMPSLSMLQEASQGMLSIIIGDILRCDMSKLFPEEAARSWEDDHPPPIQLLGNLPFAISLPLIIKWLQDISYKRNAWRYGRVQMTFTFQKEVAERMCAPHGHPMRCRLSVMCQNWCKVEHLYSMQGKAFKPQPDVDVGVVRLTPLVNPHIQCEFLLIEKLVRTLFNQRRSECQRPLSKLFPISKRLELTAKLFTVADVNPSVCCCDLSMDELNRICLAYEAIMRQTPNLAKYDHRDPKSVKKFEDF